MLLLEVFERLQRIRGFVRTFMFANAHREQDELYESALQAIADGRVADPQAIARAALGAREIEFERWYE